MSTKAYWLFYLSTKDVFLLFFCTLFVQNSFKNFLILIRVLVFLSQKIHEYLSILIIILTSLINCFYHCLESNKLKKNWASVRFCLRFAAKLRSIFFSWVRHFPSKNFCKAFSHKKVFFICFCSAPFRHWIPFRCWASYRWCSWGWASSSLSICTYTQRWSNKSTSSRELAVFWCGAR